MSHSAEKLRRGTLLCFRKFLVSKKVGDERGGGYHDFPSKLFFLTVSKHFVEEPFRKFRVSKNFKPKSGKSRFSVEKFLARSTEKFRRGTIVRCFRRFPGAKKFMDKRAGRREGLSRFSVVIIKNVGEGWDSNPYLPLQNPVVLPTVPREPLAFLTNVSEIMKIIGATETRTRTYGLRTLLSYPLCHGNHWNGISDKCQ